MEWKTIKNVGRICENNELKGPGSLKVTKFLQEITHRFAKTCIAYYDATDELPFIYRERQLHSILLPSIAHIANAVLVEQPITRKSKDSSGHGWVDYWVQYKKDVLLIELKHSWFNVSSQKTFAVTKKAWDKSIEQLEKVTWSEAFNMALGSRFVAKVAMLIVPFYQTSNDKNNLEFPNIERIDEMHLSLINQFSSTPNWSCIWQLHNRLQKKYILSDGSYEIYPCVGILAKVDVKLTV